MTVIWDGYPSSCLILKWYITATLWFLSSNNELGNVHNRRMSQRTHDTITPWVQQTSQFTPLVLELFYKVFIFSGEKSAFANFAAATANHYKLTFLFHQVPITAGWTEAAWSALHNFSDLTGTGYYSAIRYHAQYDNSVLGPWNEHTFNRTVITHNHWNAKKVSLTTSYYCHQY